MSLLIDDPDDLLKLLRKLDLKVTSVEELNHLLATLNAHHNPVAAQQKAGKLIGLMVPSVTAGAAVMASIFLVAPPSEGRIPHLDGALALIWGCSAMVSVVALAFSFLMTRVRGGPAPADKPPAGKAAIFDERVLAAVPRDLSL
jgi:hypothetical protein